MCSANCKSSLDSTTRNTGTAINTAPSSGQWFVGPYGVSVCQTPPAHNCREEESAVNFSESIPHFPTEYQVNEGEY
jgi:hypothetical protein